MRLKKSLLTVLCVFLFLSSLNNLYSQRETISIQGVVKDEATGEGLPFATIVVLGTKLGVNTNLNGLFLIKGIPKGPQKIQISAVGYTKKIVDFNFSKSDEKVIVFHLKQSPVELKTVVSEEERSRSEYITNISAHNISAEDFKTIPLPVEKDIIRSLKTVPGVSTTSDVSGKFFVRGGAGDQNLILYDDFIIYNPFHALGLFSIFDGNNVKNYEIQTGGFDPEYGGRLSSVLNITTKDGNRNYYNGDIKLGMLSLHAGVNGPIPYGTFNFSARKSLFDNVYKKFIKQDVPLSFYDVNAKVTIDFTESGRISFNFFRSEDDLDRKTINDPNYNWLCNGLGLNFQSFLEQFIFTISYSYSDYSVTKKYENATYGAEALGKLSTSRLNLKTEIMLSNSDIISTGVSVHSTSSRHDATNGYGIAVQYGGNNNDIALWAKYKYIGIPNTTIDAGIRYSHSSSAMDNPMVRYGLTIDEGNRNVLEPRINLKYKLSEDISIKGSFSTMHQSIISIQNENDVVALFESFIPISDIYNPERADQYVLGVDARLFDNYTLVLQGYLKDIFNYVDYNLNRKKVIDPDFSIGTGKSKGIELYLKFNYEKIYGWVTYNLSWCDKTIDNYKFHPRYDKTHSLCTVIGIKLPYNIDMGIIWDFATGMPFTPLTSVFTQPIFDWDYTKPDLYEDSKVHSRLGSKNSYRLPSYHKMDINFSRSFSFEYLPKVEISVDITNVYNQKNIFYYDPMTGNRIDQLPFFVSGSIGLEF